MKSGTFLQGIRGPPKDKPYLGARAENGPSQNEIDQIIQ
jgi:hypothetical protein